MNQHFKDAQHHVTKAAEDAQRGIELELEDVEARVRELTGREKEPEPSRLEKLQADLMDLERRAEGEVEKAVTEARARLEAYRKAN